MAIFGVAEKLPKEPEPKDMQRLMESMKGKEIEAVVQVMTLRSLPQACYSTENKGHFGIASTCYTHFTSPIRRYPDLMVHRLIRQALRNRLNKSQLKKADGISSPRGGALIRNGTECGGNGKRHNRSENDGIHDSFCWRAF